MYLKVIEMPPAAFSDVLGGQQHVRWVSHHGMPCVAWYSNHFNGVQHFRLVYEWP